MAVDNDREQDDAPDSVEDRRLSEYAHSFAFIKRAESIHRLRCPPAFFLMCVADRFIYELSSFNVLSCHSRLSITSPPSSSAPISVSVPSFFLSPDDDVEKKKKQNWLRGTPCHSSPSPIHVHFTPAYRTDVSRAPRRGCATPALLPVAYCPPAVTP